MRFSGCRLRPKIAVKAAAARVLSTVVLPSAVIGLMLIASCRSKEQPNITPERYPRQELRDVPPFLTETILERTDVLDLESFPVTGYGLVANLNNTGGGPYPNLVRDYMIRQMINRGFGRATMPEYAGLDPETAISGRRVAIVEVAGLMPPGGRKDQQIDLVVNAMPNSGTTSLARGRLYQTDLFIAGTRPNAPGGSVNILARGGGAVFVNPAYAADAGGSAERRRMGLRTGLVLAGGRLAIDRPIRLQLRVPQRSTARLFEERINRRFQDIADKPRKDALTGFVVAEAQDEGIIDLYMPKSFNGDWERFIGVVQHLFRNASSEFAAKKSEQLARAAVEPDAPLLNISYTWEALGEPALPFVLPLMSNPKPDVAFAATRAAAFLGDPGAPTELVRIALTPGHPSQLAAVAVLGAMPNTPGLNRTIRPLLNCEQATVRIAAYEVLARNQDSSVYSRVVGISADQPSFLLDIVESTGPTLIYATRSGLPRIALIGSQPTLETPITFTAINDTFMIASEPSNRYVNLFFRESGREPISIASRTDLGEVIARLGGEGPAGEQRLDFSYGDVVALVQALVSEGRVRSDYDAGRTAVAFVLQEPRQIADEIMSAPEIPQVGRPQGRPVESPEPLETPTPTTDPVIPGI